MAEEAHDSEQEPTMEEILASIRKIISDGDVEEDEAADAVEAEPVSDADDDDAPEGSLGALKAETSTFEIEDDEDEDGPHARPPCQCWCGCLRRPGAGGRRQCEWCWLLVGPGCCWMGDDQGICHMCAWRWRWTPDIRVYAKLSNED